MSAFIVTSSVIGLQIAHGILTQTQAWDSLAALARKLACRFYITFHVEEFSTAEDGSTASPNELFAAAQLHLGACSAAAIADMTANVPHSISIALPKGSSTLSFTPAPPNSHDTIIDTFQGCTLWWKLTSSPPKTPSLASILSDHRRILSSADERRVLQLTLHKKDKNKIFPAYFQHILAHGKELKLKSKKLLLYTNMKSHAYMEWAGRRRVWASVPFRHPATFDTLAMDSQLKSRIMEDLSRFVQGEEFYKKTGRAWKRGYLLYGPPGTGKSSMIAAMANFLQYDVYDLELTEVKSNAHLRNLLVKTTNKSIIVIEDIDCSVHLTDVATRDSLSHEIDHSDNDEDEGFTAKNHQVTSHVTLSGLLNFTDGLWSCCGSERIFVFTTNYIDKLDPALLRSGRMDMHIHMSYCSFEAFKVLASNYLGVQEHPLFENIREAFAEDGVKITPAEVTEVFTKERLDAGKALTCLLDELQARGYKQDFSLKTDHFTYGDVEMPTMH